MPRPPPRGSASASRSAPRRPAQRQGRSRGRTAPGAAAPLPRAVPPAATPARAAARAPVPTRGGAAAASARPSAPASRASARRDIGGCRTRRATAVRQSGRRAAPSPRAGAAARAPARAVRRLARQRHSSPNPMDCSSAPARRSARPRPTPKAHQPGPPQAAPPSEPATPRRGAARVVRRARGWPPHPRARRHRGTAPPPKPRVGPDGTRRGTASRRQRKWRTGPRAGRRLACPRASHRHYPESRAGGARRNRTADLLNAIQALSQLSYGPLAGGGPIAAGAERRNPLPAPGWRVRAGRRGAKLIANAVTDATPGTFAQWLSDETSAALSSALHAGNCTQAWTPESRTSSRLAASWFTWKALSWPDRPGRSGSGRCPRREGVACSRRRRRGCRVASAAPKAWRPRWCVAAP